MDRRPKSPSRIPFPRSPSPAAHSRTHRLLKTILPAKARAEPKAAAQQPENNDSVADETAAETEGGGDVAANAPAPPPVTTLNRDESTSPVPSITISVPDSPDEPQPQPQPRSPPSRASSTPSGTVSGGLHPRRARSLSAGGGSGGSQTRQSGSLDMRAMAVLCEVPEHGKAVNTIRDLKSEIEELSERVEQGERREEEGVAAAAARREREARKMLEQSQSEAASLRAQLKQLGKQQQKQQQQQESSQTLTQALHAQIDQVSHERDELLRAKRSAVHSLNQLRRERERDKRECSVAEHMTLHQRLRAVEREREQAVGARTCSMPVHHEFLKTYAEKVKEMDREILALTAEKERLAARETCTLPLHGIVLREYRDEVIRMDREIQARDKLLGEKDAAIAAAKSCTQEGSKESQDAKEHETKAAAQLKACEERLANAKAKFRKDVQSAIDELARQEQDTDAWIAHIAQRDLYTREITDDDLDRLHDMYRDRTSGFRELKKAIMLDPSEQRVEREEEEQERRVRQWLKERDGVVTRATAVIERLTSELKERDAEMVALKKGAKISIDQSKRDPERFDLKWELDNKYYGLQIFESRLKQVDQDEMLKKIEEEVGGKMREDGGGVRHAMGEPSKD